MLMTQVLAELYDCLPAIEDPVVLATAARTAAQSVGATIVASMTFVMSRTASRLRCFCRNPTSF
jgi:hypothetical protein